MTTSNRCLRGAVPTSPRTCTCSLAVPPLLAPLSPPTSLRSFPEPFGLALCSSPFPPSSQGSPLSSGTGVCDGDGSCYQGWPVHQAVTPSGAGGRGLRPLLRLPGEPLDLAPQHAQSKLQTPHPAAPERLWPSLGSTEGRNSPIDCTPKARTLGAWPGPSGLGARGLAPPPPLAPPLRAWPRPSAPGSLPLSVRTHTCGARRASRLESLSRPAAGLRLRVRGARLPREAGSGGWPAPAPAEEPVGG